MKKGEVIFGVHPVLEHISNGNPVAKVFMLQSLGPEVTRELRHLCGRHSIPLSKVPKEKLDAMVKGVHQGVVALVSPIEFVSLDAAISSIYDRGDTPLCMIADGVTDVGNIGAMARSLLCFGGQLMGVGTSNTAPLGHAAMKTSAGALGQIMVSRFSSMEIAFSTLHGNGIETIGLTEKTPHLLDEYNPQGPVAIVMGDEEKGLSDIALKKCTHLLRIPIVSSIGSLNVSVAAGIALHHMAKAHSKLTEPMR